MSEPAEYRDLTREALSRIEELQLRLREAREGSREPIAIVPLPGFSRSSDPTTTLPFSVPLLRMSATRIPRTSTPATRPL